MDMIGILELGRVISSIFPAGEVDYVLFKNRSYLKIDDVDGDDRCESKGKCGNCGTN